MSMINPESSKSVGINMKGTANSGLITMIYAESDTAVPYLQIGKSRGIISSPSPVLSGDSLGYIAIVGQFSGGTGPLVPIMLSSSFAISVTAAQNFSISPNTCGVDVYFSSVKNNDINSEERIRFLSTTGAIRFNNLYTFPIISGTSGQIMANDGSGVLSWTTPNIGYYTSGQTDTLLLGKSNTGHTHSTADITNLSTYTGLTYYYTTGQTDSLLLGKSNTGHTHTTADISNLSTYTGLTYYYTSGQTDILLLGKSNTGHTHTTADINNLSTYTGFTNYYTSAQTNDNFLSASTTLARTGGVNGSIQFNSGGTTTGNTNLVYDYTNTSIILSFIGPPYPSNMLYGGTFVNFVAGDSNDLYGVNFSFIQGEQIKATGATTNMLIGNAVTVDSATYANVLGLNNLLSSVTYGSILGRDSNIKNSTVSFIVGNYNTISGLTNTAIICGSGITATESDTVYIPKLILTNISATSTTNGAIRYTGTDFEGRMGGVWKSFTSTGGTMPTMSKTLTIETPTNGDSVTMFRSDVAITAVEIITVSKATNTGSTTFSIYHGVNRSGGTLITSGTSTSILTGDVATIYSSGITANEWIWTDIGAATGTGVTFSIDFRFTEP